MINNLCVIAGTGRNVGKTELACRLIAKISATHRVWGLKVSAIYPDEGIYHGHHEANELPGYLSEETRRDTRKDTSRMLRAGAEKVFYLRAEDQDLEAGYHQFISLPPPDTVIICESNSLGSLVTPGLLLLVSCKDGPVKQRAKVLRPLADLEIISDGRSGFPELDRISFSRQGWQLAP